MHIGTTWKHEQLAHIPCILSLSSGRAFKMTEEGGRNNSEGGGGGILSTCLSLFISREHFFSSKGLLIIPYLLDALQNFWKTKFEQYSLLLRSNHCTSRTGQSRFHPVRSLSCTRSLTWQLALSSSAIQVAVLHYALNSKNFRKRFTFLPQAWKTNESVKKKIWSIK